METSVEKKKLVVTDSFMKELEKDFILAKSRMDDGPCDSHKRREFVRTTYAAIEAQSWNIRMYLLNELVDRKKISAHEISALKEETYFVSDKGEVKVQSKGYPLKVGLKLIINILKKHDIPIQVNYNSPEWSNIDEVSRIRNRITHPKNMSDITVTLKEAEKCHEAFQLVANIFVNSILAQLYNIFSSFPVTRNSEKKEN